MSGKHSAIDERPTLPQTRPFAASAHPSPLVNAECSSPDHVLSPMVAPRSFPPSLPSVRLIELLEPPRHHIEITVAVQHPGYGGTTFRVGEYIVRFAAGGVPDRWGEIDG